MYYPPEAKSLLNECFPSNVEGRVFCTFPRNPATEQCTIHAYKHIRHTGKKSLKTYVETQLSSNHTLAWSTYFAPTPIMKVDEDVHAVFSPSSHARLSKTSQSPITPNVQFIGYGQVLNYKDLASGSFVYRFVDATLCSLEKEKNGILLTDHAVLERITRGGDTAYQNWEHAFQTVCRSVELPTLVYTSFDPIVCARIWYLQTLGVYTRYFFTGVVAHHPRTKELYSGWRIRKKK